MKKIFFVIIILSLIFTVFSGCAKNNGEDTNNPPKDEVTLDKLSAPSGLFVWANGEYAVWNAVTNASGYTLKIKDTEIEFSNSPARIYEYTQYAGIYNISVKAKGDKKTYSDSDYSAESTIIIPPSNNRLRISGGTVWGYDGTALTTVERNASELILLNTLDTTIATCTAIGQDAFQYENVVRVYVTAPIQTIGAKAFFNCKKLISAELPPELLSIESLAFYGADSLTEITLNCIVPPTLSNNVFSSTENLKIYVPEGSVDAYKSAWSELSAHIFSVQ